jgi:acyl carrier protein
VLEDGAVTSAFAETLRVPGPEWLRTHGVDEDEFLAAIGAGLNHLWLSRSGGRQWVDASPANTAIAEGLARLFPHARFIHPVRDGCRVVQSILRFPDALSEGMPAESPTRDCRPSGAADFAAACLAWTRDVETADALCTNHPDRCMTIRAEDLEASPEAAFGDLLAFLSLPNEAGPAAFFTERPNLFGFPYQHRFEGEPWQTWGPDQRETFVREAGACQERHGYALNGGLIEPRKDWQGREPGRAGHDTQETHIQVLYEMSPQSFVSRFDPVVSRILWGPIQLVSDILGLSPDGWVGPKLEITARVKKPVNHVRIAGHFIYDFGGPFTLTVALNDVTFEQLLPPGSFRCEVQTRLEAGEIARVAITSAKTFCPQAVGLNSDARNLSFVLDSIAFVKEKKPVRADKGPDGDRSSAAHRSVGSRVTSKTRFERAQARRSSSRGPDVIAVIQQTWSEVLGPPTIGPEDDFFELGGHSLNMASAVARLGERLGIDLPLRAIFEAPTPVEMAEYIAELRDKRPKHGGVSELSVPDWVVPLQREGAGRPVFVFPGGPGGVAHLSLDARVAALVGREHPFWGFRRDELDQIHPHLDEISDVAAECVRQMRNIQGKGPFLLYAICGGGPLAWESARQLLACGEEIASIFFYEVPFPVQLERLPASSSPVPESYRGARGPFQPSALPVNVTMLMNEEWHAQGTSAGWAQVADGDCETLLMPGEALIGHDVYSRREHLIAEHIRNWIEMTEARMRPA